jgi:hypothetical protein
VRLSIDRKLDLDLFRLFRHKTPLCRAAHSRLHGAHRQFANKVSPEIR